MDAYGSGYSPVDTSESPRILGTKGFSLPTSAQMVFLTDRQSYEAAPIKVPRLLRESRWALARTSMDGKNVRWVSFVSNGIKTTQ